ncbi:hypothetical protein HS088_TW03G00229 [Tripterygium wilfordii]|uniref:Secreted protein n=1 Tax=Tripterygium wilfordii TaxID=458696 RepID=A0A7J7DU55_TRIWF|nr:hypothetical protein HS088_TW03G00229 [Tripterygium wilfordii]
MNLRKAMMIWSSLPLLACALETLLHFLNWKAPASAVDTTDDALLADEHHDEVETAGNTVAQKHFRQIQHIRIA